MDFRAVIESQPFWPNPDEPDAAAQQFLSRVRAALADRYAIESEIGRGATAVVFRAHDLRHDRPVAIKVLRAELAAVLGPVRFEREIRIAAQLQHPHILPLYESGLADGLLYYVMPYVAGESLQSYIAKRGPLPHREALALAHEIANALAYAHERGVVHRDIKPGNILMSAGHALVADFGIARAMWAASDVRASADLPPDATPPNLGGDDRGVKPTDAHLTVAGAVIGTPYYMSPEQAAGRLDIDGRSDVYSLGCVLYEMLSGKTPFVGTKAEILMAQHLTETPPPLRDALPSLPRSVDALIAKALAKEPEARFATAAAFADAIESVRARMSSATMSPIGRRRWGIAAAAAVVIVLAAVWGYGQAHRVPLDRNRIVVFPLWSPVTGSGGSGHADDGEAVATYIGYALDGTAPLRWIDGWGSLTEPLRRGMTSLGDRQAVAIATAQRAGYYIDGSIIRTPDSVTVLLALHSVAGDSTIARAGAAARAAGASLPHLGIRAMAKLLPAVLSAGGRVDVLGLDERNPTAVAHFLEGEQEYREMHFVAALADYRRALDEDSLLAVAALKGGQAANWQELLGQDTLLIAAALRHPTMLSERQQWLARGLRYYMLGNADSAIGSLHHALRGDSTWTEALAALGEVYYHLLPMAPAPESLAEDAFARALVGDSGFTPPMYHLAEIAVRRHDLRRAAMYLRALSAVADSTQFVQQRLMLKCARGGWAYQDWAAFARHDPSAVLKAGKSLAVGSAQAQCASDAFRAVLAAETSSQSDRWGALLGGTALYSALGQHNALASLLASPGTKDLPGWSTFVLIATADGGFDREADSAASMQGTDYASLDSPTLWLLGEWAAYRGRSATTAAIAKVLATNAAATRARSDVLLAKIMAAREALVAGDSSTALERLRALTASGDRNDIEWQPWESLGLERLTLAQMLLVRGDALGAWNVARALDAPSPVVYPLYLRRSLGVRKSAARALNRADWAAEIDTRLRTLDQTADAKSVASAS